MTEIWALVVAVAAVSGTIYSIWRNGRHHRDSLTEFKTAITAEVKGIKEDLNSREHGLEALSRKMNDFSVRCAETRTGLDGRVTALEEKPRRRKKA